jgi:hypothetical protein
VIPKVGTPEPAAFSVVVDDAEPDDVEPDDVEPDDVEPDDVEPDDVELGGCGPEAVRGLLAPT